VTVKVPDHRKLVAAALDAGKMVMCEWPLALDAAQASDLATRAVRADVPTLIGLQARMAPAIRYSRDLVSQGYVGKVLGTVFVGSGIAWGPLTDKAHASLYDAAAGATTLTVPTMHALDAMAFVLGDLAEVRAISAIRRPTVKLSDTGQEISVTAPDHVAICGTFANGAIASVFYRGGVSRGNNLRWEINGSEGDLVLTSPIGNLQVINPTLEGARDGETEVRPLSVPLEYDFAPAAPVFLPRMLRDSTRRSPAGLWKETRQSTRRTSRRRNTCMVGCGRLRRRTKPVARRPTRYILHKRRRNIKDSLVRASKARANERGREFA
jgi:predicted dehydrogenase